MQQLVHNEEQLSGSASHCLECRNRCLGLCSLFQQVEHELVLGMVLQEKSLAMSATHCLRLFVLCFWLLVGDVNCEITQRGHVQHVHAGQAPRGVHNDNRDDKRWSEPPIVRIPAAGYKISSVDRGTQGNIYPAQEDHSTASRSSQIQSHYPVMPEIQRSNDPKRQVNHFQPGFSSASVTQRRSNVMHSRSGNKAFAFPDGEKTPPVHDPLHIYHAGAESTGRFSSVEVDKPPVGLRPNRRVPIFSHSSKASQTIHVNPSRPNTNPQESHRIPRPEVGGHRSVYVFPKSFNHGRTNLLRNVFKPIDKETDSVIKGYSPDSNSAGKVDSQIWRPRVYSSDVMSEARGYTHVRHLKPAFDKTRPQASSTADRKFLESGHPPVKHNPGIYSHDSTKLGFGPGVPASGERQRNYNFGGSQPSRWHPPTPDRAQVPIQGKFKPFQRHPTNDAAHNHSPYSETTPTQTTLTPHLNSTGTTSSIVPSVTGNWSTKSASPLQTTGRDEELKPQA
ncbi:uncharacterized protein LOC117255690 [Epinephelus lanceolatus]